jgi:hypothetical protein
MINWNIVKSPKYKGGLEICDANLLNLALRAKMVWRFISGKQERWKDAIGAIYQILD